jgi:hypothetical protein
MKSVFLWARSMPTADLYLSCDTDVRVCPKVTLTRVHTHLQNEQHKVK